MVTLVEMDARKASQALGQPVTEIELTIAKHSVMGVPEESIAELFDASTGEIQSILEQDKIQELKQLLAAEYARAQVEVDLSYESLEEIALGNLIKAVRKNHDPDLNIKVAALANKATRRVSNARRIIDPANAAGQRVQLTLTKRIIERFTDGNTAERSGNQVTQKEIEAEFRITDSQVKPSFEDIDDLLGVSHKGVIQPQQQGRIEENLGDASWEEFIEATNSQVFGGRK